MAPVYQNCFTGGFDQSLCQVEGKARILADGLLYRDDLLLEVPPGTVAYEFTGSLPDPARFKAEGRGSMPAVARPAQDVEVKVRKPSGGHSGH